MEETAALPPVTVTSATLRSHIENCGYVGDRLKPDYSFGAGSVALAGFIGKPWDARSACLAVVDATSDSRLAAHACIEFGAPTALVCRGDSLDWWQLSITGPREPKTIRATEVDGFFRTHAAQLKPENIYAAKLHRPVSAGVQMQFVDVGLMPALERKAGEALNRLVSQAIRMLMDDLGSKVRSHAHEEGVYKSVFWMLAAKLLSEKGVRGFKSLDLNNVDDVFKIVGEHYKEARDCPPGDKTWKPALSGVAATIAGWGSLGNISAESLAYLYETSLIDGPKSKPDQKKGTVRPDVRKTLGIHSTPSILVDHMLSQLWPLIDSNRLADQRVFEPACGHAAFLTAAMRDIRNWSRMDDSANRHNYLRERVRGVELDPFAVEIAKLSLTLADVPHGNTWQIETGDMFEPGVLRDAARWATVVLSNPPYEDFGKTGANRWLKSDEPVTAQTKAVEMLKRVVPNLAPGAVFGFVLPQGTLYDREAKQLRSDLLESCEVAEISLFEDKLFSVADHEACILLGRRKQGKALVSTVMYRRVRNRDMDNFKGALHFSREDKLTPDELGRGKDVSLYEPDLRDVWQHLESVAPLSEAFDVQKGFEFFKESVLRERKLLASAERPGWMPVALKASDGYSVWEPPIAGWLNYGPKTYRARGGGAKPGVPQVILNYARLDRDSWRLQAVMDDVGIAVSSRFLVFRPTSGAVSRMVLWAVLNSPVGSAYFDSWTSKRELPPRNWLVMPLPTPSTSQTAEIEAAAAAYLKLAMKTKGFMVLTPDDISIRQALIALDAAVLRLYDLPPSLERQLLAIFDGVERPGVGCAFRGYPAGWSSRPAEPSTELPDDDRPIWERIASLAATMPEKAIAGWPSDGAAQLNHYVYGTPKKTS
jgi:hypothetical protein